MANFPGKFVAGIANSDSAVTRCIRCGKQRRRCRVPCYPQWGRSECNLLVVGVKWLRLRIDSLLLNAKRDVSDLGIAAWAAEYICAHWPSQLEDFAIRYANP